MTDQRRFSHSLIDTWMDCPKKAYYRYVEQIPSPRGAALVKGTACDEAWNYDLIQKIETHQDIPLRDLLDITEQAFRDDVDKAGGVAEIDWGKDNPKAALDSTLRMSRTWHEQLAPSIQPVEVQVRRIRTLPSGRAFIGFIDVVAYVDGVLATVDNKTGGRRMYLDDAHKALQPFAYAWLQEEPGDFVFARAVDLKTPIAEFVWTNRSQGDIDWYEALITDVERAWEAGIFPPNPRSLMCGPDRCPFYSRCQPHRTTVS